MVRAAAAVLLGGLALSMIAGCGRIPPETPDPVEPSPIGSPSPTSSATSGTPSVVPTTSPPSSNRPTRAATASTTCPADVPRRLSLRGQRGRAFAFAPLKDPGDVTVEGEVNGDQAWSTSKVLMVAAFLDTTTDGDPGRLTRADLRLIGAALQRSDAEAVRSLRDRIPGSSGRAMTAVLRAIGDTATTAPDALEGTMSWSIRQQVRFMAALSAGDVVSGDVSAYLIETMRPIREHRWGLGTVGSETFKGGWLRQGRVTRQMGLLSGYAVAIITDEGPVVGQTDGDSAHVEAMNTLAGLLAERLAYERGCG